MDMQEQSTPYFAGGCMKVEFFVPGKAIGKGRPRIGRVGSHARMFTPDKTVKYEGLVSYSAHQAMQAGSHSLMENGLQVELLVNVEVPTSWSQKKRRLALSGGLLPTSKPDLDNYAKAVCDAMNGVVYKDDSQVATLIVKKRYSEAPGLLVSVVDLECLSRLESDNVSNTNNEAVQLLPM